MDFITHHLTGDCTILDKIFFRTVSHKIKYILRLFRPEGSDDRFIVARAIYIWLPFHPDIKRKIVYPVKRLLFAFGGESYGKWIKLYDTLSDHDRHEICQRIEMLPNKPLISIIMPTYNTPESYLIDAIKSVKSQLYQNWELCIADDASILPHVRRILEQYAENDHRIRVIFRIQNGHISEASNTAVQIARGEYIALLDHDDTLSEHALYWVAEEINAHPNAELIFSDEDMIDEKGRRFNPYFKSDWNPDLMLSQNAVTHLSVFLRTRVREIGGFQLGYEGAQDWDLVLRFAEGLSKNQIRHIPQILYHWRYHSNSTARSLKNKPYAFEAGKKAILEHIKRKGLGADIIPCLGGSHHRVRYHLPLHWPLVSIIIPTKDRLDLLAPCIRSLQEKTLYANYEIVIIDNRSEEPETLEYLSSIKMNGGVKILHYEKEFNYSAMHNWAVPQVCGEIVCLLNNDTEVISPQWLDEMLVLALRPEIGAVGAKLIYGDGTVQHAGVVLGIGGGAGHAHRHFLSQDPGYHGRSSLIQNFSAVTGACMMFRKALWSEVCGMDEKNLAIAYNDIDFSLRLLEKGYRNIWTPYALLYHYESKSRGYEDNIEKQERLAKELRYMKERWGRFLDNDPMYNPNLTLSFENFSLAWPPRTIKPWVIKETFTN